MERTEIISKYGLKEHATVRNPGAEIILNGEIIVVPPLSIAQFRKYYEFLAKGLATDESNPAVMDQNYHSMLEVVGEAIRRNHPEIKDEYLNVHLDMASFQRCILAVQNAPGIERTLESYIA